MAKSRLRYKGERVQLNCPSLPSEHGRTGTVYQTALSTARLVLVEWDDGPVEEIALKLLVPAPTTPDQQPREEA